MVCWMLLLSTLALAGAPDAKVLELDGWRPDGLDPAIWADATAAWAIAVSAGRARRSTLVVGDMSLPSEAERLWVVDLSARSAWRTRVAHGSGSGYRWANRFSNTPGSRQTSLGLYVGAEIYVGKHGRSLRLDGLNPSNDAARERAIVVHAADYVDEDWVRRHGRAGRSWGCPALDPTVAQRVIDALSDGGILLLSHPEYLGHAHDHGMDIHERAAPTTQRFHAKSAGE